MESPKELRKLQVPELPEVCDKLRSELVETISGCGGHFSSSLGVVELTVALHYALNTPDDRLVWDVGHQAYIHKMLTGRKEGLKSIRTLGGISGFPKRDESDFDAFGVAHAGTSVSAALGMAIGSELQGSERRTCAVVGDGALTAGMVFEALNHLGQTYKKLIVVLNDNEMSIAPNVGALSRAFSKAVTGRFSTMARRHFKSLVEKGFIPHSVYRALDRAEEAAQGFFSTPAMLFESFGIRYLGPVDGHDVVSLVETLERAKEQDGPVLIHTLTQKGHGYQPAEEDPIKYHGVSAFEPETGQFLKKPKPSAPSYTDVFGKELVKLAKQDKRVVGITAAMPAGTGLQYLAEELPDKFFDVGIAEQHAVTFAAGLACEGLRPVCAIYSTFLQRGFDQVLHDVCIQNLPVVFCMDRAGFVGADGPTHHGMFDIAYLRSLPNMTLMAPKDENELRSMLKTAIEHTSGPIAIRYPRGSATGAPEVHPVEAILPGVAEVCHRSKLNPQALLVGYGNTVSFCEQAANTLHNEGIGCSVLNLRSVKPLDKSLIAEEAKKHLFVVTVEDHSVIGGIGTAIVEVLNETEVFKKVIKLGAPDKFIEHGTQKELYELSGFDAASIVKAVQDQLAGKVKFSKAS